MTHSILSICRQRAPSPVNISIDIFRKMANPSTSGAASPMEHINIADISGDRKLDQ
jgi:hypothetical protein